MKAPAPYHPVYQSLAFKHHARGKISAFLDHWTRSTREFRQHAKGDTWLLPLVQIGPFGIRQDEHVLQALLRLLHEKNAPQWRAHLTSGYFNFTDSYQQLILDSNSPTTIITASAEVSVHECDGR
jgi:CDP-diacylglycerol--glycerol-3-phosphate 3-phosphatidyltransferase